MLDRIQSSLENLSTAERRAASWIIDHPRQAAEATLAEVARWAGVSEPTVVRFCRSVGLRGFRELSRRLTEALSRPVTYLHQDVREDDGNADAVTKVFDASIRALVESRGALSMQPFEPAAGLLKAARQIVFIGLGASSHVAHDAAHKFFRLGIPCRALSDTPSILQLASIAQAGDALVFISTRGAWPELTSAAERARALGASVIALTQQDSSLAGACSLLFPCQPAEDTSVFTPMSSRLAQLVLLDAMLVTLALALGESATASLRASKAAIL